jgi:histidyl-tRNA synthetase
MKKENRFPKYLKLKVKNLINAGWKKFEIQDYLKIKIELLNGYEDRFENIGITNEDINIIEIVPRLGHKSEAYFDEDEMEFGYSAPSYNQLSIDEKILYGMEINPKDRIDSNFLKRIKQTV